MIVGVVFVYQVISSDIANRLAEYATLKAIGRTNRYLAMVVLQQSLLLAVLGYVPALLISLGLYSLTEAQAHLPMDMPWPRMLGVFVLAVTMCSASGLTGACARHGPPTPRSCFDMGWLTHRVPLAWKNLTHSKVRFTVAVAGITFAVLLMFVQFGFRAALLDSNTQLVRALNGELVILHQGKYTLFVKQPFSRRRIEQARAVDGVRAVYPIYTETQSSLWKTPLSEGGGEFATGTRPRTVRPETRPTFGPFGSWPSTRRRPCCPSPNVGPTRKS